MEVKIFWGSTFFGDQHFWGVKLFWRLEYFGGEIFLGAKHFKVQQIRGVKIFWGQTNVLVILFCIFVVVNLAKYRVIKTK